MKMCPKMKSRHILIFYNTVYTKYNKHCICTAMLLKLTRAMCSTVAVKINILASENILNEGKFTKYFFYYYNSGLYLDKFESVLHYSPIICLFFWK